jgi:hypothetical protein
MPQSIHPPHICPPIRTAIHSSTHVLTHPYIQTPMCPFPSLSTRSLFIHASIHTVILQIIYPHTRHPSLYLCTYPSMNPSAHSPCRPPIYLFMHACTHLSLHPGSHSFFHSPANPLAHFSIYLYPHANKFIYLSTYPSPSTHARSYRKSASISRTRYDIADFHAGQLGRLRDASIGADEYLGEDNLEVWTADFPHSPTSSGPACNLPFYHSPNLPFLLLIRCCWWSTGVGRGRMGSDATG